MVYQNKTKVSLNNLISLQSKVSKSVIIIQFSGNYRFQLITSKSYTLHRVFSKFKVDVHTAAGLKY